MAATPEALRKPHSVEPPPPDLFGAANAGANVARPTSQPTACCGCLHCLPIIAIIICIIIASVVNIALALGDTVPFVPTLAPGAYTATSTTAPSSTASPDTTTTTTTTVVNTTAAPSAAPAPSP